MVPRRWTSLILAGLFPSQSPLFAQPPDAEIDKLLDLELHDLASLRVRSVSKYEEDILEAPAAVFVISSKDLQRLGVTTIPEALRIVPGMTVGQITANNWAVSARGFQERFATKLLVLIDGRTIFNPITNGVVWELNDLPLDDIERIEVIRGPGATVWGQNATNGVVNIITKSSFHTGGSLASIGGGTHAPVIATLRYGGAHDTAAYRVYGHYAERDEHTLVSGQPGDDRWKSGRAGFRIDAHLPRRTTLEVYGDLYHAELGATDVFADVDQGRLSVMTAPSESAARGGSLNAILRRRFSSGDELQVQSFVARDEYEISSLVRKLNNTEVFLEAQHRTTVGTHRLLYALNGRWVWDATEGPSFVFVPNERQTAVYAGRIEDRYTVIPDTLFLTAGTKFEHNDFSGFEVQPSIRAVYHPTARSALWGAISRAVTPPGRLTEDVAAGEGFPLPVGPGEYGVGKPAPTPPLESEVLMAYELGARAQVNSVLSADIATFYKEYTDVTSGLTGNPSIEPFRGVPVFTVPTTLDNGLDVTSYGFEAYTIWRALRRVQLHFGYSFHVVDETFRSGPRAFPVRYYPNGVPEHQATSRLQWDIMDSLRFDAMLYYVDRLSGPEIPPYLRTDVRLAYDVSNDVEASLVVRNLFDDEHRELVSLFFNRETEVPRTIYGKVGWSF